jgi:hypothetical protein
MQTTIPLECASVTDLTSRPADLQVETNVLDVTVTSVGTVESTIWNYSNHAAGQTEGIIMGDERGVHDDLLAGNSIQTGALADEQDRWTSSFDMRSDRAAVRSQLWLAGMAIGALLAALLIAILALATPPSASAAPSGAVSARHVVDALQANGYRVIVNKVGSNPLERCTVISTRPGRDVTRTKSLSDDRWDEVVYTTIYVDARC